MKMSFKACGALLVLFVLLVSLRAEDRPHNNALPFFKAQAASFAASTSRLKAAIDKIEDHDTATVVYARQQLAMCREEFKKLEFLMEYFFIYPVNLYNRAPVYEVEEPFMEWQSPVGMQVIEALLYEDEPWQHKTELQEQAGLIKLSAGDIPGILYGLTMNDKQLLESARLEVLRVISLGITGFDAPQLKTGLSESAAALSGVKEVIAPVLATSDSRFADSVAIYLDEAVNTLATASSFDGFDRMGFLTKTALPLQRNLKNFVIAEGLLLNSHTAINDSCDHLFCATSLNEAALSGADTAADARALVALGRRLFFEPRLSGKGTRSCATCHQPEKYFTDGLAKSLNIDGVHEVRRNAPSLLYSGYQHAQFLDGRAHDMQEQIMLVLQNPEEMNADLASIPGKIKNHSYKDLFKAAFPYEQKKDSLISLQKIGIALAAFEQSLAPFASPFDRYMNGDPKAMTPAQVRGFNLFMGKAQCGTCHFAPLFNNLLPPFYELSELEVLGTPKNGSLQQPISDDDSGRYHFFPVQYNNGAFKTPSLRNVAVTAPYMHNGSFNNLKDVVEFYNKGGGQGIGLIVPEQTLSATPINLNEKEVADIVHFLESLTDPPASVVF